MVPRRAGIAQLVERLIRNEEVRGSNPRTGTILFARPYENPRPAAAAIALSRNRRSENLCLILQSRHRPGSDV